jgi:hypothetical protein
MKSLHARNAESPDYRVLRTMLGDAAPPSGESVFLWIRNSARRMRPYAGIVAVTTTLYEHLQKCNRRISKFDLAKNVVAAFADPPPVNKTKKAGSD